jgi:hypothetical protein
MRTDPVFERVRRANPVPAPQSKSDRRLFTRITSSPGDPRLVHQQKPLRGRRGVVVAIAIGVTAVAASTALAVSQWHHAPIVGQPVTKQEYLDAQQSLELPPGATWPEFKIEPNTVTGRGGGASRAVMVSQHAWDCYWVAAIRSNDVAGQQRAHAQIEKLLAHNIIVAPSGAPEDWAPSPEPKVPYAVWADDGGLQFFKAAYAAAAAGKPGQLIQTCRANGG